MAILPQHTVPLATPTMNIGQAVANLKLLTRPQCEKLYIIGSSCTAYSSLSLQQKIREVYFNNSPEHPGFQSLMDQEYLEGKSPRLPWFVDQICCVGNTVRLNSSLWPWERLSASFEKKDLEAIRKITEQAFRDNVTMTIQLCDKIEAHLEAARHRDISLTQDSDPAIVEAYDFILGFARCCDFLDEAISSKDAFIANCAKMPEVARIRRVAAVLHLGYATQYPILMRDLERVSRGQTMNALGQVVKNEDDIPLRVWARGLKQGAGIGRILHLALEELVNFFNRQQQPGMPPANLSLLESLLVNHYSCEVLKEKDEQHMEHVRALSQSSSPTIVIDGKKYQLGSPRTSTDGDVSFPIVGVEGAEIPAAPSSSAAQLSLSADAPASGSFEGTVIFKKNMSLPYIDVVGEKAPSISLIPVVSAQARVVEWYPDTSKGACVVTPLGKVSLDRITWQTGKHATVVAAGDQDKVNAIAGLIRKLLDAGQQPEKLAVAQLLYDGTAVIKADSALTFVPIDPTSIGKFISKVTKIPILQSAIKEASGILQDPRYGRFYLDVIDHSLSDDESSSENSMSAIRRRNNCPASIDVSGTHLRREVRNLHDRCLHECNEQVETRGPVADMPAKILAAIKSIYIKYQLVGTMLVPSVAENHIIEEVIDQVFPKQGQDS